MKILVYTLKHIWNGWIFVLWGMVGLLYSGYIKVIRVEKEGHLSIHYCLIISTTIDLYSHVTRNTQKKAVDKLNRII